MAKFIVVGVIVFVALVAGIIFLPGIIDENWERRTAELSVSLISGFLCLLLAAVVGLTVVVAALLAVISNLLDKKVGPLLDKVNETADTAKGTVAYVGEGVVSPLVKVSMILAAIRGAINALFKGRPSRP